MSGRSRPRSAGPRRRQRKYQGIGDHDDAGGSGGGGAGVAEAHPELEGERAIKFYDQGRLMLVDERAGERSFFKSHVILVLRTTHECSFLFLLQTRESKKKNKKRHWSVSSCSQDRAGWVQASRSLFYNFHR